MAGEISNIYLEMLKIALPSFITIIGFIINILITKSSIKEEVVKKKTNISLEKLSDVPFEVLELLNGMLDGKNDDNVLIEFKQLISKIFSYGSEDAIKIASSMQQYIYTGIQVDEDKKKAMCYYILLCCQIKYDLTGIKICPDYWFKLRMKDYHNIVKEIAQVNNKLVKELNLKEYLEINIL